MLDMSASGSPAAPHRHSRILACVLCQHRKIKCDRNSPCSNCIKANVTCVPSTPAPARRRRRPNQDIQERLVRCEELLKQYVDGSAPSQQPAASHQISPPAMSEAPISEGSVSTPTCSDKTTSFKPAGRMVNDDGGVRFMDSCVWATVYEELQAMREIVEKEDVEDSSIPGTEELTPENHSDLLFPGDPTTANIEDLVPDPMHSFKLWQLFLDRVNPLFKVVHVPTIQPVVLEGAINIASLPHHQQALVFSVYTTASLSLSEAEAVQILGMSREAAVQKFLSGTKVALIRFNFLKNYNMTALQALFLFMQALQGRYDRHAAWVLTGNIVRIAQKMGYHLDGESLGLDMYETEMRRRLWWQIVIQDSKYAMLSGLSRSLQPLGWDTKLPSNVNDADIFPGSTEKLQSRQGPTEMAFVLIITEIYKFKMMSDEKNQGPAFEAALLGYDLGPDEETSHAIVQTFRQHFQELDERLMEMEHIYVDVNAGNIHKAAKSVRQIFTGIADMMVPITQQPEYGTEIFGPRDNLFKMFIIGSEQRLDQYEVMGECGFLWLVKSYIQLDVFVVVTGQLCQRPTGKLADRAWAVVERLYGYHEEMFDLTLKQYFVQAHLTLKAWRTREQYFLQNGRHLITPHFIHRLRELLPSADSRSPIKSADTSPPALSPDAQRQTAAQFPGITTPNTAQQNLIHQQAQQPQQAQVLQETAHAGRVDPFLGGLFDMSNMNWDMLGDVMNSQEQLNMAMFTYGGFSAGNNNVNMSNNQFQ